MGKRGPKRQAGRRTANGRLSASSGDVIARAAAIHDITERDALSVGLEARVRVWNIDPAHSRDQMAGSVVGRLCMQGELTRVQYDAAGLWLSDLRNFRAVIAAPRGMGAVDLNAVRGDSTEVESVVWARRCRDRMAAARAAVQAAQNAIGLTGNLWAALSLVVEGDGMLPHMVGDTRVVLNALARHYGLVETHGSSR